MSGNTGGAHSKRARIMGCACGLCKKKYALAPAWIIHATSLPKMQGGRAKLAGHSARPAQHCRWGGSVAPQGNRDEIKFVLSKIRLAHRRNP
jgi:hypothetical protein